MGPTRISAGAAQPTMRAILACIVLGWLLALQPLVSGYVAAAASGTGHFAICRGLASAGENQPGQSEDHEDCCLAGCTQAGGAVPALRLALGTPDLPRDIARTLLPQPQTRWHAGFRAQAARAPPPKLSA